MEFVSKCLTRVKFVMDLINSKEDEDEPGIGIAPYNGDGELGIGIITVPLHDVPEGMNIYELYELFGDVDFDELSVDEKVDLYIDLIKYVLKSIERAYGDKNRYLMTTMSM